MFRKVFKCFIFILMLILIMPVDIHAITLGEYEAKVKKYKEEIEQTEKSIKLTNEQIQSAKTEINNIAKENQELEEEIETLREEIENSKIEIKEKSLQTKEYFAYLQVANGENAYLEYAFGADNITDFIYRMSIVEQMAEYNQKVIESLEEMIDRNNKREEEIKKKEKDLASKKANLEKKVIALGETKESLEDGGINSKKQLKIYEELVASYKKLNCKSSDVIGVDCAVNGPAGVFRRPVKTGSITSEFGSRWGSIHRGLDITSPNMKKEKIYPVANGTIISKYYDNYGELVVIMEHYNSKDNTWYSSLYAHMSSYAPNIYVGKYLTSDQYIGYMGNTGYVIPKPTKSNPNAGTHLHIEVVPCRIYKDNKCGTWGSYVNYVYQLVRNGYKGPRQLINFPSSGVRWNSR